MSPHHLTDLEPEVVPYAEGYLVGAWEKLVEAMKRLENVLADFPSGTTVGELSPRQARKMRATLRAIELKIGQLATVYDRVIDPGKPFNPGSPELFSRVIADELTLQPSVPLGKLGRFYGSGVYALYYKGDHPAYALIRGERIPIYVGQALPEDPNALTAPEQGESLWTRLSDHRDSVREAEAHPSKSLQLTDFRCRYLVLDSAWHEVAETHLIRWFSPVWNKETKVCSGLGKHGDSATTRANKRSAWDTLHPGRSWAKDSAPNDRTPRQIQDAVLEHCKHYNKDGRFVTEVKDGQA